VTLALLNRLLDIQSSDDAIFRGADRKIDKGRSALMIWQLVIAGGEALFALGAPSAGFVRVTTEAAILDDLHLRQQSRECTSGRGLSRAAFSTDEHAADAGDHGVENQCAAHTFLTNDRGKRVDCRHGDSAADYIAGEMPRKRVA